MPRAFSIIPSAWVAQDSAWCSFAALGVEGEDEAAKDAEGDEADGKRRISSERLDISWAPSNKC